MPTARNPFKENSPIPGSQRKEILDKLIEDQDLPNRLRTEFAAIVTEKFGGTATRSLTDAIKSALKIHISTHEYHDESGQNASFSVETLRAIIDAVCEAHELTFSLTGAADSYLQFSIWKEALKIVGMIDFVNIAERDGIKWDLEVFAQNWQKLLIEKALKLKKTQPASDPEAKRSKLDGEETDSLTAAELHEITMIIAELKTACSTKFQALADFTPSPYSSTAIREAIKKGDRATIEEMTSPAAAQLIMAYYTKPAAAPTSAASAVAAAATGGSFAALMTGSSYLQQAVTTDKPASDKPLGLPTPGPSTRA